MTVITENTHLRGQVDALKGGCGGPRPSKLMVTRAEGNSADAGGGTVIRTTSVFEREKVATNAKFGEVGLNVSVNRKLGQSLVQGVHTEISHDEFMEKLLNMNLREFSPEANKSDVRLVSRKVTEPYNLIWATWVCYYYLRFYQHFKL